MKNPTNLFKAAIKAGTQQIGIWNSIGGPTVIEQLACCGFDWILIDAEHTTFEVNDILLALQAVAGFPSTTAIVRPPANDPVVIKRLLDSGAQTLLLPYIQTGAEARAAVEAMRYGPRGIRGFAGITRATRYGRVADYATRAEEELCLLLQVESVQGLENLEEIATTDGVDGVFIGPADLAASMGHPGQTDHPDVVAAIEGAIADLNRLGVPAGILSLDKAFARRCIELGTVFTAVGVDLALLDRAADALAREFTG